MDDYEIALPEEEEAAATLARPLVDASKILLILDMNGLLVDRRRQRLPGRTPDFEPRGAKGSACFVYDRPHVRDFTRWALQRFALAVWSSASEKNLLPLVKHVFGKAQRHLRFVWAQDRCSTDGVVPSGRRHGAAGHDAMKPRFLKELEHVFAAGLGGRETTLLLDDDEYKACRNPPHTAVHPAAFTAELVDTDDELGEQGALRCYLEFLSNAASVPAFVEKHKLEAAGGGSCA